MLEGNEKLNSNTIMGQVRYITELSDKLKERDRELKEIKDIRIKTESKNTILSHKLEKIRLAVNDYYDNVEDLKSEIKSILEEATKQL